MTCFLWLGVGLMLMNVGASSLEMSLSGKKDVMQRQAEWVYANFTHATPFLQYTSSWALNDGRIQSVGVLAVQEM